MYDHRRQDVEKAAIDVADSYGWRHDYSEEMQNGVLVHFLKLDDRMTIQITPEESSVKGTQTAYDISIRLGLKVIHEGLGTDKQAVYRILTEGFEEITRKQKQSSRKGIKDQLIKLGSEHPDLRDHLRPVLDHITKTAGSSGVAEKLNSQIRDQFSRIPGVEVSEGSFSRILKVQFDTGGLLKFDTMDRIKDRGDFIWSEMYHTVEAYHSDELSEHLKRVYGPHVKSADRHIGVLAEDLLDKNLKFNISGDEAEIYGELFADTEQELIEIHDKLGEIASEAINDLARALKKSTR